MSIDNNIWPSWETYWSENGGMPGGSVLSKFTFTSNGADVIDGSVPNTENTVWSAETSVLPNHTNTIAVPKLNLPTDMMAVWVVTASKDPAYKVGDVVVNPASIKAWKDITFELRLVNDSGDDLVWNGANDREVAAVIEAVQNDTRKNASGPKITSNAHSAEFPGIYFIWDSKQSDNGYLKVHASVFDKSDSFTLTAKTSNSYWDFEITIHPGQEMTEDDCFVFYIPKVNDGKKINMVFISE